MKQRFLPLAATDAKSFVALVAYFIFVKLILGIEAVARCVVPHRVGSQFGLRCS
jgi:hypothetical protein